MSPGRPSDVHVPHRFTPALDPDAWSHADPADRRRSGSPPCDEAPAAVRAFVACPPPEQLASTLRVLRATLEELSLPARLLPDDALHVTLLFLGAVPVDLLDRFWSAVRHDIAHAAPSWHAFDRLIALPGGPRPRVVAIQLMGDDRLSRLHDLLCKHALDTVRWAPRDAGIAIDRKPFRPHLTLARLHADTPADTVRSALPPLLRTMRVSAAYSRVCLMQSDLTPTGARYTLLDTVEQHGRSART